MSWALIGQVGSKRTSYFLKAAEELGCLVRFVDIESCKPEMLAGCIVKIDPPAYSSSEIALLPSLTAEYTNFLKQLSFINDLCFLNHPNDILATLDKKRCKQLLLDAGIPTTPTLSYGITCYDELVCKMRENSVYGVFVKPNTGSGAAGVVAFRLNPRNGEALMYTSVLANNKGLFNTKQVKRITAPGEVKTVINKILAQNAIVEQWIPKAAHGGVGYDLRVVWQLGKIAFIVPRFSKSPITNLHLNNMAGLFDDLQLSNAVVFQIEQVCNDTMKLFPRLSYAGIDILLTRDSLRPMVIEVNGQGDLIYQDIYAENLIYKQQLKAGEMLTQCSIR